MTFRETVQSVPQLAVAFREGLQALRRADHARVVCVRPRRLKGSVDIDTALREILPNDPRWDYGIGYYNGRTEEAIWIEVHPATSDHVSHVTRKAHWLRNWLSANARVLLDMTREYNGYVWLSAGAVSIQRGSRQARELALAGVSFPRKRLELP
jgi:hypothetical protein